MEEESKEVIWEIDYLMENHWDKKENFGKTLKKYFSQEELLIMKDIVCEHDKDGKYLNILNNCVDQQSPTNL